jgi:membrane fusion protein, heavy metal efflux system
MKHILTAVLLGTMVFASCTNNGNGHGHEHGLEPLVYTIYTPKTELFVEFKPLVLGQECAFAAHFTELGEYFKAIAEGTITLTLQNENSKQSVTATEPEIPGIFRLRMTPEKTGEYKLVFDIKTPRYTDQVVIEKVTVYADEHAAEDAAPSSGEPEGEITYLKEQAWKIDFATIQAQKQPFYEVVKTSGQIMSAPGDEVVITAKSSGIVFFSGNNSIVGSPISKGQGVFTVSGGGLTENNIDTRFKEAKSNYEIAKADYERAEKLIGDQIISQKEFLEIKNRYEVAENTFRSLSQNYVNGGTKITAPISGYLKNVYVTEGQYVNIGDPIASVSQNKKIMLQADVAQTYFALLSNIRAANFVTVNNQTYDTDDLNGKVIAYGKSASNGSAFIPVTFEIDNRGEILPGSYVDVYLKTNPIADALVIPVSALMEEQGLFFVYVQVSGESFTKREVKLGGNDGQNVQVLSGLSEGERVVSKGALNIKLSVASGTLPAHGHEH